MVKKRPATPASYSMLRLIEGVWLAKAIQLVVDLRIPDVLRDRPKTSATLAASTRTHAPSLHRVMRALAQAGVFALDRSGRFALTPLGATLRADVPGSLRDWARLMLGPIHRGAWDELTACVRTGGSAFGRRYGVDLWTYRAKQPQYAALFDSGMTSFTTTYVEDLLASYSFSAFSSIVDVGGGDGTLLIRILGAYPRMRGVLFDLPPVVARATQRIARADLADRCVAVRGDAFAAVPSGGDAYTLSRVIHDWDDEAARRILVACRKVLPRHGRVLVIERVLPEDWRASSSTTPVFSDMYLTDLNMMVMTGGRERTLSEYRRLLRSAGLELVAARRTGTAMSVLEARVVTAAPKAARRKPSRRRSRASRS